MGVGVTKKNPDSISDDVILSRISHLRPFAKSISFADRSPELEAINWRGDVYFQNEDAVVRLISGINGATNILIDEQRQAAYTITAKGEFLMSSLDKSKDAFKLQLSISIITENEPIQYPASMARIVCLTNSGLVRIERWEQLDSAAGLREEQPDLLVDPNTRDTKESLKNDRHFDKCAVDAIGVISLDSETDSSDFIQATEISNEINSFSTNPVDVKKFEKKYKPLLLEWINSTKSTRSFSDIERFKRGTINRDFEAHEFSCGETFQGLIVEISDGRYPQYGVFSIKNKNANKNLSPSKITPIFLETLPGERSVQPFLLSPKCDQLLVLWGLDLINTTTGEKIRTLAVADEMADANVIGAAWQGDAQATVIQMTNKKNFLYRLLNVEATSGGILINDIDPFLQASIRATRSEKFIAWKSTGALHLLDQGTIVNAQIGSKIKLTSRAKSWASATHPFFAKNIQIEGSKTTLFAWNTTQLVLIDRVSGFPLTPVIDVCEENEPFASCSKILGIRIEADELKIQTQNNKTLKLSLNTKYPFTQLNDYEICLRTGYIVDNLNLINTAPHNCPGKPGNTWLSFSDN
jgi:hypothetical protein